MDWVATDLEHLLALSTYEPWASTNLEHLLTLGKRFFAMRPADSCSAVAGAANVRSDYRA